MPYYKKSSVTNLEGLIARLAIELSTEQELLTSEPQISADAPTIVEETGLLGRVNVIVIWNAWRDLSGEQRGAVIMRAYEKVKGPGFATQIGLAMGLTPEQRQRINSGAVPNI